MRVTKHNGTHYALMGVSEIAEVASRNMEWMRHQEKIQYDNGAMRTEEFLRKVSTGDNALVEKSEEMLAQIEDQIPLSLGWRNFDDVVGAVPNIPAYLAGHPQNMRRRERVMRNTAPLTIFMNLSSSMAIGPEKILARGIVLLALTRRLVEHRAVELWVGTSLGERHVSCVAAWRVDTTPLDLARAAFHISHPSMSRLFGYATCEMMADEHLGGRGRDESNVDELKAVAGWHDVLYIPPIYWGDPMTSDPVAWIKRVLGQYVDKEEAA